MTLKAVDSICPAADVPKMLRELADYIESGEESIDRVTVIYGANVACYGPVSQDRAAEGAVFDMTWGIHYMMGLPVKVQLEMDGE